MDNSQIPPVQPVMNSMPSSGGGFGGTTPGMGSGGFGGRPGGGDGQPGLAPNGMPMVQQIQLAQKPQKDVGGIVKIIAIVVLTLVAMTFIGLFIWKYMEYEDLVANWDTEKDMAVAEATDEQAMDLAKRYNEEKKYPYETFMGPADYGQLSFEYPKTWSVYVDKEATNGGDFAAYLNPQQVGTVSNETLNALRVTISTRSFDDITQEYQKKVDQKNSDLKVKSVQVGNSAKGTVVTANRYEGTIPDTEFKGVIVVFKIRDKTVILQTDSEKFAGTDEKGNLRDFEKILNSLTFNA